MRDRQPRAMSPEMRAGGGGGASGDSCDDTTAAAAVPTTVDITTADEPIS